MKIRLNDGAEFEGSPVAILEAMKEASMFTASYAVDEYIDFLVGNARKFHGKAVEVQGTTTEERATSLIDGLLAAGMAEVLGGS